MKLNEQTMKDIDRAFRALEAIEDIKAEIKQKVWDTQEIDGEHKNYKVVDLSDVLQILDNIGKAESEDKE